MSAVIKDNHLIGGIQVNVYKSNRSDLNSVAILFLLHGREGSVKNVDSIARTIVEKNNQQQRKLWVVTFVNILPFFEIMS